MIKLERNMEISRWLSGHLLLHLGTVEDEYRREHFKGDKMQSVIILMSVAFLIFGMLRMDQVLFAGEQQLFLWMAAYRLIYLFVTSVAVLLLLRIREHEILDRIVFGWALMTAVYLVLFNFTRPANYLTTPFDILFPFGLYLLSPLRLKYNSILTLTFSIAIIIVDTIYKSGLSQTVLSAAVVSQIMVHLIGLPASMQIQSYRRKSFKAYLDQKDAREMANYLINIDGLTKCMTRQYFMEMAEKEFLRTKRYNLPLSLLMLDLDHFKRINDRYGHQFGDQILQRFATVALEQKRAQDIFGRLGGEEFALLLPNTALKNARLVAERIQQTWASASLAVDGQGVRSTVSIGVVEINSNDPSFYALLHRSDSAMYNAKRRGRNRVSSE